MAFILKPKHSFIDDKQSDVLLAHTPASGYDRCVHMEAWQIGGDGVKHLVEALREVGFVELLPQIIRKINGWFALRATGAAIGD